MEDICVLLFVGYLYLNGYLYFPELHSNGIRGVLVFDWYVYSMGTYTPEFKVLHLSCLLPLPTFLHNVQWKFKKDSEKGDKKKKSSLIRTHFEVLIIPSIIL